MQNRDKNNLETNLVVFFYIIGVILMIFGNFEYSIIPFSYCFTHLGYYYQRETYRKTFVFRSIELESAFCLLYGTHNIEIIKS